MSKRLQVTLSDSDYREIQRLARSRNISTAEWVRQALGLARRREQASRAGMKLAVIRAAVEHEFPSGDIESMLEEIENGYNRKRNRKD
ncbi:MAG TPA: ribbon-helix-helix protein, CopG family [Candidatus Acidoferrales bacterium]|nr:ribbon-helix-helix protein, CopG family [Candidatus Acidoferrales bacterium]